MSDIKFNGEEVEVEGNWLRARVLDLKMDAPSRRINNNGERRALVHDFSDGLTINYASDYPGGVTLNGDVKSDNNQLNLGTWDLCLDHPARRENETPHRRALVHDFDDGLTINWGGDYPGGVTVNGDVKSNNNQLNLRTWDLCLDHPDRRDNETPHRRALVHDFNDGLTINWAQDYPGGVTISGSVNVPGTLTVGGKDVGALLTSMQTKIDELEARVAALES